MPCRVKKKVSQYLWLTTGVVVALFVIVKVVIGLTAFAGAKTTTAVVTDISKDEEQEDSRGKVYFSDRGIYSFVVDGKTYQGTERNPTGGVKIGDKKEIEYNPIYPEKNRVKGDRESYGNLFMLALIGGIFAAIAIKANYEVLPWRIVKVKPSRA